MSNFKEIYDANGDIISTVVADEHDLSDGKVYLHEVQDCEPILEYAKQIRENHRNGGDLRYRGSVPATVYYQAVREGWAKDEKAWAKFFKENPAFTGSY